MACGNNNNRGGNLGGLKNILDFNVTYTGCETSCGGREIKTGDSLRNVLDALVANCDGGSGPVGSSTNFWFSRNVPTFTADVKENDFALTGAGAIYEFVDGEWQNTGIQIGGGGGGGDSVWGSITGEITDQTDLTEYINLLITEAPVNDDHIGTNLHIDADNGKLNAGQLVPLYDQLGARHLVLGVDQFNPELPDPNDNSFIAMTDLSGAKSMTINAKTAVDVNGGAIQFQSESTNLILRDNALGGFEIRSGLHQITTGELSSGGGYGIQLNATGTILRNGGTLLSVSSEKITANRKFEYTAEVLITSDRELVPKKYVDDLIAAQAATIADLTSRIEALENA